MAVLGYAVCVVVGIRLRGVGCGDLGRMRCL